MSTLFANASVVATMDDDGTEHEGGWILVEDGLVREVGSGERPAADEGGRERVDGRALLREHRLIALASLGGDERLMAVVEEIGEADLQVMKDEFVKGRHARRVWGWATLSRLG